MVTFWYDDEVKSIENGEIAFCGDAIGYRDVNEELIRDILADESFAYDWRAAVRKRIASDWVYSIIADERRGRFFQEVVPLSGKSIVDLGSGWGQVCLPLARRNEVLGVEASAIKAEFVKRVAEVEGVSGNLAQIAGNAAKLNLARSSDLVVLNGFLEWYPKYSGENDGSKAQVEMLEKVRRWLNPNGKVVVGIENRIGLKYLLGVPDDHTGTSLTAVLEAADAKRKYRVERGEELMSWTHSLSEYKLMFKEAGYGKLDIYYPFPDYKFPRCIFREGEEWAICDAIAEGSLPDEWNGYDGSPIVCNEELRSLYKTLVKSAVFEHFAPSFYFVAAE